MMGKFIARIIFQINRRNLCQFLTNFAKILFLSIKKGVNYNLSGIFLVFSCWMLIFFLFLHFFISVFCLFSLCPFFFFLFLYILLNLFFLFSIHFFLSYFSFPLYLSFLFSFFHPLTLIWFLLVFSLQNYWITQNGCLVLSRDILKHSLKVFDIMFH